MTLQERKDKADIIAPIQHSSATQLFLKHTKIFHPS